MDDEKRLGISEFNKKRIEEWKKLTALMHNVDKHTKCPICDKEQMIGCICVQDMAQDILESIFYRKVQTKKGICELCGKEIPNNVIFNTNPLTIAQYFTSLEYRKEMGKEGKWCFDCTHKKLEEEQTKR